MHGRGFAARRCLATSRGGHARCQHADQPAIVTGSSSSQLLLSPKTSLAPYTTLGIGGRADYLTEVTSRPQLDAALRFARARALPLAVVGNGSNVLVDDSGYAGVVVVNRMTHWRLHAAPAAKAGVGARPGLRLGSDTSGGTRSGDLRDAQGHALLSAALRDAVAARPQQATVHLQVGAGCAISLLGSLAARSGLAGLEFAVGIPGTVGGAIAMNAGAHGSDMAGVTHAVELLDASTLAMRAVRARALDWGYRSCALPLSVDGTRMCITSATVRLRADAGAWQRAQSWLRRRRATQPVQERSAGCAFRNPENAPSAGQLIEEAGLKGLRVGGAGVSTIHANYLINATGSATAADFRQLMDTVQERVLACAGVLLELEVQQL